MQANASWRAPARFALVGMSPKINPEVDDRLRDLRPDSGDDALRAISRAATAVLTKCCATCVRAESSVPTRGTARIPSQSLMTGVGVVERAGVVDRTENGIAKMANAVSDGVNP